MSKFQTSSNKSSSINFPSIRPSLDLDFANSKTLDPRITFTRSSGGSYVGPDGLIKYAGINQPRFDHDPITGECLGLMIGEQRTNLLTYSNSFSTGGLGNWTYVNTNGVFTQNVIGPDGISNSAWTIDDRYTANDGFGFEQVKVGLTPSRTTNYCLSIFVKQGTAAYFDFYAFFTGSSVRGSYLRYTFSTGSLSVGSAEGPGIAPTIYGKIIYPNGWVRVYFTVNDANNGANNTLQFRIYPASRDTNKTGTTLFYGAQLEEGLFPTSYIPTQASSRTRAADDISISGTKFTSWYNQTEGTLYSKSKITSYPSVTSTSTFWGVANTVGGINNNRISIQLSPSTYNYRPIIYTNGTSVYGTNLTSTQSQYISWNSITISYNRNDCITSINGKLNQKDNIVDIPSTNIFFINATNHSFLLSRFTYYPKRLPDSQLQALTK